MSAAELGFARAVTPLASVWCRQVDNEAESPGYTAIPDEFPGRREALDAIRIVGNLTINVADTHDYWDPDPSQTLSFYPNLFLYPAAGGRFTCVGRMFLSTEDRPRLGMKTLVFATEELVASGDFGGSILRAHATMVGRAEPRRPSVEPDAAVFQAVGEGFLFHRGTTEPVVVVASEQWDAVAAAVAELVRSMPVALVALGGFLVFPYFLPAPKVDLREFTEQIPLALAVMRVPRVEAEGDRHTKRMQSWGSQPVSLRDLTRPPTARGKDSLPLVLQYIRDHQEPKMQEVVRRVDQVEGSRLSAALADPEAPTGRERRKEMWRIGTAMETAALLLSRPRGKTVSATGEMAKRANAYLEARPGESPLLEPSPVPASELAPATAAPPPDPSPPPAALTPSTATPAGPPAEAPAAPAPPPVAAPPAVPPPAPAVASPSPASVPQWLRAPPVVNVPAEAPASVPVSTSEDPSLLAAGRPVPAPTAWPAGTLPSGAPAGPTPGAPLRAGERLAGVVPSTADRGLLDARLSLAVRDLERRWNLTMDARLRDSADVARAAAEAVRADFAARLAELEKRPPPVAPTFGPELEAQVAAKVDPKIAEIESRVQEAIRSTAEGWAERFRRDLKEVSEELAARAAKSEEDLRTALVAQLDLELMEAKEQGTSLREEIEAKVREILDGRLAGAEERRTKDVRELEQRVAILVDGRTKDVGEQLSAALSAEAGRLAAAADDRVAHVERRLAVERDARLAEINEAHRAALAGLQVRMQAFVEQSVRETQAAEQEKYVELLARLKAELEGTIAGEIDSADFDNRMRERVQRAVDGLRGEQRTAFSTAVADAEQRIHQRQQEALGRLGELERQISTREGDLTALEARLQEEISDLDRRVMVVNDHVLPIVRQTWLKLSEQESAARQKVTDAQVQGLRKELLDELHRAEEQFTRESADLRDRLEVAVQSHGRIWLNFLRQYPGDIGGFPVPASSPASHRVSKRLRPAAPPPAPVEPVADRSPFASDPPNPMDPELGATTDRPEPRRRTRKTS